MNADAEKVESCPHPADSSPLENLPGPVLALRPLQWLIRLRWLLIGAGIAALAIERQLGATPTRPPQVVWALAFLAAANVGWWLTHRYLHKHAMNDAPGRPRANLIFAHAQIALDLVVLTVLLRFTGGVESPLAIFYVFHTALGALLLPPGHTLVPGIWAIALYAGVSVGELSGTLVQRYPLRVWRPEAELHIRSAYVVMALGSVALGILGTLYLTGTMASRLRKREGQLQDANAALRHSQDIVRELQSRRSRFMQTAAHRLKSPLATIQTMASLIRDDLVGGADARATCDRITRCCSEGIEHVGELLTLARVQDADPLRHRATRADVGAVIKEQCERFQSMAVARGVHLTGKVPSGARHFAGVDRRDLVDCVGNLIDNALKYTPAGGQVTVWVEYTRDGRLDRDGEWIAIHVDDTGMGFDPQLMTNAHATGAFSFDAYRRGNNALASGIPGSGLGLAIVQAVVEQAAGRIDVVSARGTGTKFTLKLPAVRRGAPSSTVRNETDARQIQTPPIGVTEPHHACN
ncbi:hypothetical protein B7486_06155 [cyanobacterium TDX16]|nr:hypothetical protein B7486_06155 [cyanobacterium TDX16]